MLEKILYKSKNLGSVEIYNSKNEEENLVFENCKIKSESKSIIEGYGLRAINKNKKLGFSSATKIFNDEDINNLISAVKISQSYGHKAQYSFPAKIIKNKVKVYSEDLFNIPSLKFINLGKKLITYFKENVSGLRVDIYIQRKKQEIKILNNEGGNGNYEKSYFTVFLAVLLTEKDGLCDIYDGVSSCVYNEDNIFLVAKNIVDKIKLSKNKAKIATKKYKVLFTPKAVASLFASLTTALNGRSIERKISPLTDKENKKIFSEKFTVIDSALEDYQPVSYPFDAEGMSTKENILIKNGVLKNFLLDLHSASKLNKKSTGNAKRSFSTLPSPSENNLLISSGKEPLKNILKNDEIVYVDQLLGWAGNPLGGEYSGNIGLGFLVKKGEFQYRIKDAVISGNIYQDLNKIIALSKETFWTIDGLKSPYFLLDDVTVAGL